MKRSCAQRLAEAIVKNKSEPVFRPDEQLLSVFIATVNS
jgi:hypothetical protein